MPLTGWTVRDDSALPKEVRRVSLRARLTQVTHQVPDLCGPRLFSSLIGAPLTVGICGFLTIGLASAVLHWSPHLRQAKRMGES